MRALTTLITILALHCIDIATAQATESRSVNITEYNKGPLPLNAANNFLICLNETNIPYQVYVHTDGAVTIIPPEKRDIDLDGTDTALLQCLKGATRSIMAVVESTSNSNATYDTARNLDKVTYEWLQEQGAAGLVATGFMSSMGNETSPSNGTIDHVETKRDVEKRTVSYYWAYLSEYSGCSSYDAHTPPLNSCRTWSSSWTSVRFENVATRYYLLMRIWPHHDCTNGGKREFLISPASVSSCHTRTTYSYKGTLYSCSAALC